MFRICNKVHVYINLFSQVQGCFNNQKILMFFSVLNYHIHLYQLNILHISVEKSFVFRDFFCYLIKMYNVILFYTKSCTISFQYLQVHTVYIYQTLFKMVNTFNSKWIEFCYINTDVLHIFNMLCLFWIMIAINKVVLSWLDQCCF